uniref:Integrase catalytic domain-containing protein n=1 Tax=Caenorhabditis tropicalis TaxID=1561998 RepID=A0A1I7T407_9PELO
MSKWSKEFKKRITTNCTHAKDAIADAEVLLSIPPEPSLVKNLNNKIADLHKKKAALEKLDLELRQGIQNEINMTEDEKVELDNTLKLSLEESNYKRLQTEIDQYVLKLEQLSLQITATNSACGGVQQQITGPEITAPGSSAQTGSGDISQSGVTPQVIPPLQDVTDPDPTAVVNSQSNNQALEANDRIAAIERDQQITNNNINTLMTMVDSIRRSQSNNGQVNRTEPHLENTSCGGASQGAHVHRVDCVTQNDASSRAGHGINQSLAPVNPSYPVGRYGSGAISSQDSRIGSSTTINVQGPFNSQTGPFTTRQENYGRFKRLTKEQVREEMEWERASATVKGAVQTLIQPFSGEPLDYPAFISRFEMAASRSMLIDDESKQIMLLGLLPESLRRQYQTTEISHERYWIIRRNLERQFNRSTAQKNTMIQELNNISFPDRDDNKLSESLNRVSSLVCMLGQHGVHNNDAFLINSVVSRLPSRLRSAANKLTEKSNPTMDQVLDAIHDAIAVQTGTRYQEPQKIPGYDEAYTNQVQFNAVQSGKNKQQYNAVQPTGRQQRPKTISIAPLRVRCPPKRKEKQPEPGTCASTACPHDTESKNADQDSIASTVRADTSRRTAWTKEAQTTFESTRSKQMCDGKTMKNWNTSCFVEQGLKPPSAKMFEDQQFQSPISINHAHSSPSAGESIYHTYAKPTLWGGPADTEGILAPQLTEDHFSSSTIHAHNNHSTQESVYHTYVGPTLLGGEADTEGILAPKPSETNYSSPINRSHDDSHAARSSVYHTYAGPTLLGGAVDTEGILAPQLYEDDSLPPEVNEAEDSPQQMMQRTDHDPYVNSFWLNNANTVDVLPSTLICDSFTRPEDFAKELNSISIEEPDEPPDPIKIRINQLTDAQSQLPFIQLQTPSGGKLIALVDTGAQMSIISSEAAQRLQLAPVGRRKMSYAGFIAETGPNWCIFYRLEMKDLNGESWTTCLPSFYRMNTVFRAPNHTDEDFAYLRRNGLHIEGVTDLRSLDGQRIDMILGNNVLNKIKRVQPPRHFYLPSGRAVEQLVIGFVNHPPVIDDLFVQVDKTKPLVVSDDLKDIWIHTIATDDPLETYDKRSLKNLEKQVEQLWNLEVIGIQPPAIRESKEALNLDLIAEFKKSATIDKDNIIHVALPFNGRQIELHNNLPVAKRRLASLLERQLQKEEDREAYHQIIMKQLESGIIEEASEDATDDGRSYVIPHRAVIKEESLTTKLRIVLDASSHMRGELSLNDCLFPGPSILQPILGIHLRSRMMLYLMTADIEKAFHQIFVKDGYRNFIKFVWLKDPAKGYSEDNLIFYRFTRLPFGVSCSPFLLAVTIMRYLELNEQDFNQRIIENLYVDNIMFTSNNKADMKYCHDKAKEIFNKMHMNLREFACNSSSVTKAIAEKDRSPSKTCKLLGHTWDSEADTITIKIAKPPAGTPTKKQIVSFAAKNYDPSGMVSPIIVKLKLLISKLWKLELKWNDKLPQVLMPLWEEIISTFTDGSYTFPRRLTDRQDYRSIQLILFSDASKYHYAATAYLRFEYGDNEFKSGLIFSKSKVRPSNGGAEFTIPRMELLAFEIASNAAVNIAKELHIEIKSAVLFSDSTCCLYWILNKVANNVGTIWVTNRVQKIQKNLLELQEAKLNPTVRYVPTDQNPADIASRGCSLQELRSSSLWNVGPTFLQQPEDHWPKKLDNTAVDPHTFHEQVTSMGVVREPATAEFVTHKVECATLAAHIEPVIPFERTNSLSKLTRWTATVAEFVCRLILKRNQRHPKKPIVLKDNLWRDFMNGLVARNLFVRLVCARRIIIRYHYRDAEMRLNEFPSRKLPVELHEDGSWRYKTRYSNAEDSRITPEMKFPTVILPNHPLARLIAIEAHEKLNHQGTQDVITEIHQKYWIEAIGSIVRKVRQQCWTCRKKHARPFKYNYNRILPPSRTSMVAPFKHIGLDYIGPLRYQRLDDLGKMYILLITCLITRAVHLEVVTDLTTLGFVNGLRRFISRRGSPTSIYSDNAPQFKLAYSMINEDLETVIDRSNVFTSFLAKEQIEIKFITPLSPWQGGVYERLVGLVKTLILKVLQKERRPFLEMETLVIEAEGIINSRPITPNKKNEDDAPAIRPIDFINPGVCLALPEKLDTVYDVIKCGGTEKLTRLALEGLGRAKEELWKDFAARYFYNLKELKENSAAHSMITPKEGMIVLVIDEKIKHRHHWPIGRIVQITKTLDGSPRSVRVKFGDQTLEKAVSQLIPLEDPGINDEDKVAVPPLQPQEIVTVIPPKRGRGRPRKIIATEDQPESPAPKNAEISREPSPDSGERILWRRKRRSRKGTQECLQHEPTQTPTAQSKEVQSSRSRAFLPRASKKAKDVSTVQLEDGSPGNGQEESKEINDRSSVNGSNLHSSRSRK